MRQIVFSGLWDNLGDFGMELGQRTIFLLKCYCLLVSVLLYMQCGQSAWGPW